VSRAGASSAPPTHPGALIPSDPTPPPDDGRPATAAERTAQPADGLPPAGTPVPPNAAAPVRPADHGADGDGQPDGFASLGLAARF
jgi:hypothetical protein